MTAGAFRRVVEPVTAEELLETAASNPCPTCDTPWETVTAVWNERVARYVIGLEFRGERGPSQAWSAAPVPLRCWGHDEGAF